MMSFSDSSSVSTADTADLVSVSNEGQGDRGRLASRPKLLYLVAEDHYFWTHRLGVATAAQAAGFEVIVVTRAGAHANRIREAGFRLIPLHIRRNSLNPVRELWALQQLVRLYRRERPTVAHHVALKPMLYGTIAARLTGVTRVVNAVAGLGGLSNPKGLRARFMSLCARLAMRVTRAGPESVTIFQTEHDRYTFAADGLVRSTSTVLIRGAGVDLERFAFNPNVAPARPPVVMLAGRLLWSKGIRVLVDAGRELRARGRRFRVVLVGVPDHENLQAVPEEELEVWQQLGVAEWWGFCEDMPTTLATASIVVLPTTYGEGVPKILLEAGAVGRPVVATDIPGCREVITHGNNGLLVPVDNVPALVDALDRLLTQPSERTAMGIRARARIEADFSDKAVANATLAVYRGLLDTLLEEPTLHPADGAVRD